MLTPHARPTRVLLIESCASVRRVLEELLTNAGHEVEVAPDARQGQALFLRRPFDAVIADLGAGSPADLRVVGRLCTNPSRPGVLVTSSRDAPDLRERARRAGARRFFAKPFDVPTFLDAVREAVSDPPPVETSTRRTEPL